MLITKLGGLLNRRVYFMPFSRALKLKETDVKVIFELCKECTEQGGIMLVQPEHILSFQLMGPECLISGNLAVGHAVSSVQSFLDQRSRDIVDESDENFSTRFEIVYTMGSQRPVEMSPQRWIVTQQVLEIVRDLAPAIAQQYPSSMEIKKSSIGSFPVLRITQPQAGERLLNLVAERICSTGLDGLPIARLSQSVRVCLSIHHGV